MNDDSGYNSSGSDNQFVLSYELICLLQWIMEHDSHKVKAIVSKALASGLKERLRKDTQFDTNVETLEDIQEGIIDFFGMLESLLLESLNEHALQKAVEKDLLPSIDQIDSTVCDDSTVRFSVEKATSDIENNPQENPKELLFKELLRHWKPSKKNVLN